MHGQAGLLKHHLRNGHPPGQRGPEIQRRGYARHHDRDGNIALGLYAHVQQFDAGGKPFRDIQRCRADGHLRAVAGDARLDGAGKVADRQWPLHRDQGSDAGENHEKHREPTEATQKPPLSACTQGLPQGLVAVDQPF